MVFTKDSGLTKVWVGLIMMNVYTIEQVPRLFNLKEAVAEVIGEHKRGRRLSALF